MKTMVTKEGLPPSSRIYLQELGHRLRLVRKKRGYSRDRLASLTYLGRNTIARMEKGDPGVSVGAWSQVLHVLGTDRSWLLLLEVPEEGIRKGKVSDIDALSDSL